MVVFMMRRVLQAIAVLLLVTLITFGLLRLIPGNPAIAILGPAAYRNPLAIAQFDAQYGFNRPWYGQYWLWLDHLLHFNLGYSWNLNQSVASLLGSHLPKIPGHVEGVQSPTLTSGPDNWYDEKQPVRPGRGKPWSSS